MLDTVRGCCAALEAVMAPVMNLLTEGPGPRLRLRIWFSRPAISPISENNSELTVADHKPFLSVSPGLPALIS